MAGNKEREKLKNIYPSKKWAQKIDKMSTSEIAAITMRLKQQNRL